MERRLASVDNCFEDAEVPPGPVAAAALPRLKRSAPVVFVRRSSLGGPRPAAYVQCRCPACRAKTAESIALLCTTAKPGLQKFIGQADWGQPAPRWPSWRGNGPRVGRTRRRAVLSTPRPSPRGTESVGRAAAVVAAWQEETAKVGI